MEEWTAKEYHVKISPDDLDNVRINDRHLMAIDRIFVAARNGERGSRHRPFPGARPRPPDQSTARERQPPTELATAVKGSNDRMRESRFSSYKVSWDSRVVAPPVTVARIVD